MSCLQRRRVGLDAIEGKLHEYSRLRPKKGQQAVGSKSKSDREHKLPLLKGRKHDTVRSIIDSLAVLNEHLYRISTKSVIENHV